MPLIAAGKGERGAVAPGHDPAHGDARPFRVAGRGPDLRRSRVEDDAPRGGLEHEARGRGADFRAERFERGFESAVSIRRRGGQAMRQQHCHARPRRRRGQRDGHVERRNVVGQDLRVARVDPARHQQQPGAVAGGARQRRDEHVTRPCGLHSVDIGLRNARRLQFSRQRLRRKHDRAVLGDASRERCGADEHPGSGLVVPDHFDVVPQRQRLCEDADQVPIGTALHDVLQHLVQRSEVIGTRGCARQMSLGGASQPAADRPQVRFRNRRRAQRARGAGDHEHTLHAAFEGERRAHDVGAGELRGEGKPPLQGRADRGKQGTARVGDYLAERKARGGRFRRQ